MPAAAHAVGRAIIPYGAGFVKHYFFVKLHKKKCLPEEDTFLMIRPAPWVGLSNPTYHVWL